MLNESAITPQHAQRHIVGFHATGKVELCHIYMCLQTEMHIIKIIIVLITKLLHILMWASAYYTDIRQMRVYISSMNVYIFILVTASHKQQQKYQLQLQGICCVCESGW